MLVFFSWTARARSLISLGASPIVIAMMGDRRVLYPIGFSKGDRV